MRLALALAPCAGLRAGSAPLPWRAGDAADQVLVLWRSPLGAAELAAEAARLGQPPDAPLERLRGALDQGAGAAPLRDTPLIGLHHVRLAASGEAAVDAALAAYRASGLVASAEPNHPLHAAGCPSLSASLYASPLDVTWSPSVAAQWGLTSTAWPQAVAAICAGQVSLNASVTVAIIDSGLDSGHQEFPAGMVLAGAAFINGVQSAGFDDQNGHGTFVAGLIGATPDPLNSPLQGLYGAYIDPTGPGHELHLLPVKVLDACGSGTMGDLAAGLVWAAAQGVRVVNMSLESSDDSDAVRAAVNAAWASGVVMTAAAGNFSGAVGYPAGYAPVISVAALDHFDGLASYSNFGKVDLSAPGGDDIYHMCNTYQDDFCLANGFNHVVQADACQWEIFSLAGTYASVTGCANYGCATPNGFAAGSGTSFAAPLVAAAAAMLFSQDPGRGAADVVQRLEQSALPTAWGRGWNQYAGWGKLDFAQALDPAFTPAAAAQLTVWNYPNPFKPSRDGITSFSANLPYAGPATLEVYDAAGQRVRHYDLDGPGMTRVDWDGRNGAGSLVANGGYRGVLRQGSLRSVAKVAVLQ